MNETLLKDIERMESLTKVTRWKQGELSTMRDLYLKYIDSSQHICISCASNVRRFITIFKEKLPALIIKLKEQANG